MRDLEKHFADGEAVNAQSLIAKGLVRDETLPVKVLGCGELSRRLKVSAGKVSQAAREKIEKAGGTIEVYMPAAWTRPATAKKTSA